MDVDTETTEQIKLLGPKTYHYSIKGVIGWSTIDITEKSALNNNRALC
ncbi:unnamed protein product [Photorhabdus laumondii subsp. laumondii TTO1]|uniref:Photorhabdus luminescens subsp. laumondii TTO1 complete genome segment 4/17 n=1 Tax=Photorhabdus laumondii subsp. laumondii (strain DSM 15139 / CIP 105565 / TT01) TaxID=243265 RepID=Q7N7M3_PHOLL|nr:unnamed protein product [Photorhabdus laumondii subsp. laumondii TTO1]